MINQRNILFDFSLQIETKKMMDLFTQHKINPLTGLLGLLQMPVFMGLFFGLKEMSEVGLS